MGYDSRYEISIFGSSNMPDIETATCEHKFSSKYSYCPHCGKSRVTEISVEKLVVDFVSAKHKDWDDFNPFTDECKWYEHNEDMTEFSLRYPETIFLLHGEGE